MSTAITTVLKDVLGNSEGLMRWSNKVGLQGMTMEQARARNRNAGIGVHDVLERAAKELRTGGGDLDEEAWQLVIAKARASTSKVSSVIADWIAQDRPLFIDVERELRGPGFHGRCDYTRMCGDCGRLIVGDLKPSGPYVDAHLQVAAYEAALTHVAEGQLPDYLNAVCHSEIVVYGDGPVRVYRGLATPEDWYAVMGTFEALNRVRRRMLTP